MGQSIKDTQKTTNEEIKEIRDNNVEKWEKELEKRRATSAANDNTSSNPISYTSYNYGPGGLSSEDYAKKLRKQITAYSEYKNFICSLGNTSTKYLQWSDTEKQNYVKYRENKAVVRILSGAGDEVDKYISKYIIKPKPPIEQELMFLRSYSVLERALFPPDDGDSTSPASKAWIYWVVGGLVVAGCAIALVLTCGGATPAIMALGSVSLGMSAPIGGTAATLLAGATIGTSLSYGGMVLTTAIDSKSVSDFMSRGSWEVVAVTITGGLIGVGDAYLSTRAKKITVGKSSSNKGAGSAGKAAQNRGVVREQKVANLTGGTVSRQPIKSTAGSTDIDVISPNGDLIMVGGPAKANNLGALGQVIKIYQDEAAVRGVKAFAYFSNDTPQNVIDFTIKRIGQSNVFIFD